MLQKLIILVLALSVAACSSQRSEERPHPPAASQAPAPAPASTARALPPPNPERNAYFGDLHLHTSYSTDAFLFMTRTTPATPTDLRGVRRSSTSGSG